jgi:hypothetical protein
MIDDRFAFIDNEESGAGPTVVFFTGSCNTGAVWAAGLD